MHFWVFQIIQVATPSVMYLGYAIHKIAKMEPGEADKKAARIKPYAMPWKQHRALEETKEDYEEDPMMYPEMELESEKENKEQSLHAAVSHQDDNNR
ncbi:gap junction gamma-1 protein [Cricetulus griseus]|uniref:Gap junction gamma-1 protein n=1 Tax=Cricetulus griseus TaxID=10029 RepID=A0A061ID31_CRIGR|nr:gap junction gamma-1 protein [Cricetulus griseus]